MIVSIISWARVDADTTEQFAVSLKTRIRFVAPMQKGFSTGKKGYSSGMIICSDRETNSQDVYLLMLLKLRSYLFYCIWWMNEKSEVGVHSRFWRWSRLVSLNLDSLLLFPPISVSNTTTSISQPTNMLNSPQIFWRSNYPHR